MIDRKVKLYFSKQGDLLFRNIKDIKLEELIDWFVNVKKISIGGADIMDYLKYKKEVKEDGTIA